MYASTRAKRGPLAVSMSSVRDSALNSYSVLGLTGMN